MTRIGITPKTKSLLIPVYKPVGKTPLESVEMYKSRHLDDPHITVSYGGRLDPMAEGVLLLLVGDANARRREYEHLEKEYEVTVLVGFSTDTGDLMGKITKVHGTEDNVQSHNRLSFWSEAIESTKHIQSSPPEGGSSRMKNISKIRELSSSFVGLTKQRYPIYSSAKVKGKPLFWWARQGRLDEIEIPTHTVKIDTIEIVSHHTMRAKELLKYIVETVGSVKGDFRQTEIIAGWKEALSDTSRARIRQAHHDTERTYCSSASLFTLRVTCGPGTYMRQLIMDIGEKLDIPLCAFKIIRTRVGEYRLDDCV